MFDLITGKARHLPSHSTLPILLSTTAQAVAAAAALVMPGLFIAEQIPEIPTMLVFVATASPARAPASACTAFRAGRAADTGTACTRQPASPLLRWRCPKTIEPEPAGTAAVEDGVPGGIEGGVPGGIVGGIIGGVVGGLPEPPPPPAPASRPPVRIGGQIQAPTLLQRVEPIYPPAAIKARLQGLVILEALVDRDGTVSEVTVLRSAGSVLDREALIAVRQWRYSPLVLKGERERFVLTVILSFSVESRTCTDDRWLHALRAK